MWQNILVPLDGTAVGEAVLPYALQLARKANAELQLVHVFPPGEAADQAIRTEAYVRKLGVRAGRLDGVPVRVSVSEGRVEARLCACARRNAVGPCRPQLTRPRHAGAALVRQRHRRDHPLRRLPGFGRAATPRRGGRPA